MAKQIFKSIGKVINFTSILSPKLAAHLSIKLFSTPQKGAIQNRDSKFLKNAIQEDAFYENIKIKTYRW
ncbi:MAG: alpha/beta hydrolase, partial [Flaviramulus sp.]|nr:alpha/beta hydrolase [Flaviramulus sp.]